MEWIKCSERMPKYDYPIIICTTDGDVMAAWFRVWTHVHDLGEVRAFEDEEGVSFTIYPANVTHWMPMPNPPED